MMREAMQQLQHESDRELARVLDKNQFKRLKEIQLQVEGPSAVLRETWPRSSRSTRSRTREIQEILKRATRPVARRWPRGGTSSPVSGRPSKATTTSRPPTRPIPNAPAGQAQNGNTVAAMAAGGTAAARRTGWSRRRWSPAAVVPAAAVPAAVVLAAAGRTRPLRPRGHAEVHGAAGSEGQDGGDEEAAGSDSRSVLRQVYKVLDRRQSSAFKKMLGKPFDVDSMTNGFFRGPGQRGPGGGGGPAAKSDTAKADTAKAADSEAKNSDQAATSKPTAAPRDRACANAAASASSSRSELSPNAFPEGSVRLSRKRRPAPPVPANSGSQPIGESRALPAPSAAVPIEPDLPRSGHSPYKGGRSH